eukprot:scaffold6723_cov117-Alexandrium_tamarense.AAC.7
MWHDQSANSGAKKAAKRCSSEQQVMKKIGTQTHLGFGQNANASEFVQMHLGSKRIWDTTLQKRATRTPWNRPSPHNSTSTSSS